MRVWLQRLHTFQLIEWDGYFISAQYQHQKFFPVDRSGRQRPTLLALTIDHLKLNFKAIQAGNLNVIMQMAGDWRSHVRIAAVCRKAVDTVRHG